MLLDRRTFLFLRQLTKHQNIKYKLGHSPLTKRTRFSEETSTKRSEGRKSKERRRRRSTKPGFLPEDICTWYPEWYTTSISLRLPESHHTTHQNTGMYDMTSTCPDNRE